MDLGEDDFRWAVEKKLISTAQAEQLWKAFQSRGEGRTPKPQFDGVHVAYYFGAVLVMLAMGTFMTLGWEAFGGGGIFLIAAIYAAALALIGKKLLRSPKTRTPGGLLITMSVAMAPLATYGLERMTGLWPDSDPGRYRDFHVYVRSGWLWMEVATVLASVLALRLARFPFVVMPLAFALWYVSMDLAPLVLGADLDWQGRAWVSAIVGFVMLVVAFIVDRRTRDDYAFWLYLFGLAAFWGGLSSMSSDSELNKLLYCLINLTLIVLSVLLERRAFTVFGGLGVFGYLGNLSWHLFKDSVGFPFALSTIGILIIFTAVKYAKNHVAIDERVMAMVPALFRAHLPRTRNRS